MGQTKYISNTSLSILISIPPCRKQVKMAPPRRKTQLLEDSEPEIDESMLNHSPEEKRDVRNKIEVGFVGGIPYTNTPHPLFLFFLAFMLILG